MQNEELGVYGLVQGKNQSNSAYLTAFTDAAEVNANLEDADLVTLFRRGAREGGRLKAQLTLGRDRKSMDEVEDLVAELASLGETAGGAADGGAASDGDDDEDDVAATGSKGKGVSRAEFDRLFKLVAEEKSGKGAGRGPRLSDFLSKEEIAMMTTEKGERVCIYHLEGGCRRENDCVFTHPPECKGICTPGQITLKMRKAYPPRRGGTVGSVRATPVEDSICEEVLTAPAAPAVNGTADVLTDEDVRRLCRVAGTRSTADEKLHPELKPAEVNLIEMEFPCINGTSIKAQGVFDGGSGILLFGCEIFKEVVKGQGLSGADVIQLREPRRFTAANEGAVIPSEAARLKLEL